ncbi:CobW family GTP-binding protein [Comamonas endophytica]|uniref:GTP-binding protein n=1 Tax=Comamonas endophytica TaxID=2949090 RepID=A0ABY6GC32_9BURK|nr:MULTISPECIES: GTP-binding protein [unclassified Acidovorax]MCD2513008.1 GTP-binding protein [Acidovorax sp. D4N7]UYG52651.1 GTP-binding protein [Acidovorax sp. 5MLIR]
MAGPQSLALRDARTPVIVVSGFLGAGKTTLLRRVLAAPELANTLLIVNEIGEIGIDHHLLERSDDRTMLLDNGCVCCQLRGDLQEMLVDIGMRRRRGELPGFDRVVVETSGLADPGPVAQTLYGDAPLLRDYRLGHVVTLVDPTNAAGRAAAPGIAARQVAAADRVVFSKADRATPGEREAAQDWVRGINAFARCQEAAFGDIPVADLADATPFEWLATAPADGAYLGRRLVPHPAGVGSFALRFDLPLPRALLREFLELLVRLRGADLLRVKGIVRYEDAPGQAFVVQGVGHQFDREVPLAAGAALPEGSSLVLIGRRLVRDEIQALWQAMRAVALAAPAAP